MKRFLKAALAAAVLVVGSASASASASAVSITGSLGGANDVQLFSFTIASDSDVTLRTWSYAGGTNAAGDVIAGGGFDPVLALYFGSGDGAILINDGTAIGADDGAGVAVDAASGKALDSLLDLSPLLAGTYTVALTQVANFANGPTLGDGFLGAGNPRFDGRTSAWALDIVGVDAAAAVPEPATLALTLLALGAAGGAGAAARRSRPQT